MTERNNVAKLIYISDAQKRKLLEIQDEVSNKHGSVSLNELIRASIELLIYFYKDEIVDRYTPKSIKELVIRRWRYERL